MNSFNFINKRCLSKFPGQDLLALKVFKLDQLKESKSELYIKNLKNHYGCVNAIEFSENGKMIVSGGDDKRVLVWNMASCLTEANPRSHQMNLKHESNIFSIAIVEGTDYIYSAGNDCCIIRHNIMSGKCASFHKYADIIYCLSTQPDNGHVLASACENNRVIIQDIRLSNLSSTGAIELITDIFPMHGVDFNPIDTQYVATANSFAGTQLWDIRSPKKWILKYESVAHHFDYETKAFDHLLQSHWSTYENQEDRKNLSAMSVKFDSSGRNLLVLRRRGFPVLYRTEFSSPKHIFIDEQRKYDSQDLASDDSGNILRGYFNSCTMKSGCFAGCKDEYAVSGSDDLKIYLWKIPEESDELFVKTSHTALTGHRSIPNQVRFDANSTCLISSGVEKVIKMWMGLPLNPLHVDKNLPARRDLNLQDYLNVMLSDDYREDVAEETTEEDVQMIAFFDSLIDQDQRRHRDRNQDRAFFDIYEDYDPMMDSESDISSLNLNSSQFYSSLNYHSRSTSQSETSILDQSDLSSRTPSPSSSFDPELDNNYLASCVENEESLKIIKPNATHVFRNLFDEEIISQDLDLVDNYDSENPIDFKGVTNKSCEEVIATKNADGIVNNNIKTIGNVGCHSSDTKFCDSSQTFLSFDEKVADVNDANNIGSRVYNPNNSEIVNCVSNITLHCRHLSSKNGMNSNTFKFDSTQYNDLKSMSHNLCRSNCNQVSSDTNYKNLSDDVKTVSLEPLYKMNIDDASTVNDSLSSTFFKKITKKNRHYRN